MKHLILLVLLCISQVALAADFGCGRDTDRSGGVDNWCPGTDQDHDGVTSSDGDCDDRDWQIYPGIPTGSGCSANQWRMCKADGTGYTSCTGSTFDPTTADNQLHTDRTYDTAIYIDGVSGNDSTGNGSAGSPYKTLAKVSSNAAGAVTITDGTAIVLRAATYTDTFSYLGDLRFFYQTTVCGTKGCALMAYPGETVAIVKTETATAAAIVEVSTGSSSAKWTIQGLEIDGGSVGEGVGISFYDSGLGHRARNNYVHDIDGNKNNNLSGIRCYQGARCDMTHNFVANVCDTASGSCALANQGGIECQQTGCQMNYNVVTSFGTNDDVMGFGVRWKHANESSDPGYIIGNYISQVNDGINVSGINVYTLGNLVMPNNKGSASAGNCISFGFTDPNRYFGPGFIRYNTCAGDVSSGISIRADRYRDIGGAIAADGCSGTYDPGTSYVQHNVIAIDSVTFGIDNGVVKLHPYGPDSLRSYFYPDKFVINDNCYYNTGGYTTSAFNDFAANDANTACSGRGNLGSAKTFAQWKTEFPTFDSSSYWEDPSLGTISQAQSPNCSDKGYLAYLLLDAPVYGGGSQALFRGRGRL